MSKNPKTYQEAFDELQSIAEQLESDQIGIDQLTEAVKRSRELVTYCQQKLRAVEKNLEQEGE